MKYASLDQHSRFEVKSAAQGIMIDCPACKVPLSLLAEPPSAHGFEFSLYGCPECQYRAMDCFCVASSIGGTESVTPEDAAIILTTDDPLELRRFMKAWQDRGIG